MKIAEAFVELRVDRKRAEREARDGAKSIMKDVTDIFKAGVYIAGIQKSVAQASDLNETITKTKVVFKDASAEIIKWSESSARSMGMSQKAALDAASTFAIFGSAAGLAGADLNTFSQDLVNLGADFASFYNTSPEQAIYAIGAALRGESEPIRAYGVMLDEASLKAAALKMGIYDGTGALTQQQKVLAAQAEIMRQSGVAQGDFARTADGAANSQRTLNAEAANASASFGQVLLPVYERVLEVTTFLVTKFAELPQPVQTGVVALIGLAALSGPIGAVKGVVVDLAQALVNVAGSGARAAAIVAGVGGALALAGVLYWQYGEDKRRAEQVTNEFVEALRAEASGQRDAVKALIAREIAESKYLDTATKLGLQTADTAKIITGQTVPAYDELRVKYDEIMGSNDSFDRKMMQLKDTFGVNATEIQNYMVEVDRLAAGYSSAVEKTDALSAAEEALGVETSKAATSMESAEAATEDLSDAQQKARDKFKAATQRMNDQREALEDLYDTLIGQVDLQRAYERAVDDSEDAAAELQQTMSDSKSTLEDISDATRAAADAAIGQAKSYAELNAGSTTSKAGIDAMIESLRNQANALAPDSPLRAELERYIAELEKIPTQIDTSIRLRVTGQTVTRDGDIIGVRALPGQLVQSAHGRYVPARANLLSTFGEQGPEAILPLDKPNRLAELLADPRIGGPVEAAMSSTRATGGGSSSVAAAPVVHVYIGDRELTDLVDVRIDQWDRVTANRITRGKR